MAFDEAKDKLLCSLGDAPVDQNDYFTLSFHRYDSGPVKLSIARKRVRGKQEYKTPITRFTHAELTVLAHMLPELLKSPYWGIPDNPKVYEKADTDGPF